MGDFARGYLEAWRWGLAGRDLLRLPTFLLYRGFNFIKPPDIFGSTRSVWDPSKGMNLAVIPVT